MLEWKKRDCDGRERRMEAPQMLDWKRRNAEGREGKMEPDAGVEEEGC